LPPAVAPPTREDPEIDEAKRRLRLSERNRRGRRSTILTGGQGVLGDAQIERPRGAQLLGQAA
jgi:hypothetical protein